MHKKKLASGLYWLWISLLILIIDQYSKHWVNTHLTIGEPLVILPFFNLTLAYNQGAAFSFLQSASGWQTIFLSSLSCLVSIGILLWLFFSSWRDYLLNISLCLILAGAIGNLLDRLQYRYVIDFFDFHIKHWHFAIFNIADSAIFIGACLLIIHWLRENRK